MEAFNQEPVPLARDLKVSIKETSLVFPPQHTVRKTIFLSNIDQLLNFHVPTIHFFASQEDFPFHVVVDKLKNSLGELLLPYDFLAGRLKKNPETSRLEIECNCGGAGFVVASSECTLEEVGELVYPNPAFAQLIKCLDTLDQPLFVMQVTSFKCGGFAMGVSTNHITLDGISFKIFLENLAAVISNKPPAIIPCNDRHLLAARSPPCVTFPHPELLKLDTARGTESSAPIFDVSEDAVDFKIYRLTSGDIFNLKERANSHAAARISDFNVVTAHVWRCKALSFDGSNNNKEGQDLDRLSTLLYAVNIRARLKPPLPASYTGNAVLTAYASAKCKELEEGPLSRLVEMVAEGAKRVNDEYARSAIDWMEINKGFPHGEFLVSSWWKLGFDEAEYPWGCPKYSCPLTQPRKDIILLFPDAVDKNGVSVLVALPSKQMNRFHALFHKFLSA